MGEFSIRDAALTGFRVVREHPSMVGIWAIGIAVCGLALNYIAVSLAGPDLQRLVDLSANPTRDPEKALALFERLAPLAAILIPSILAVNAVFAAAINRAVFNPTQSSLGYLRLGRDEALQFGLGLLAFTVFFGAYIGLAFVFGFIGGILALATGAGAEAILGVSLVGVFSAMAVLWVRLSLASALTFEGGRVNLFGSWALTRGRAWPLARVYALSLALFLIVQVVAAPILALLVAALNGGDVSAAGESAYLGSTAGYFTPTRLAQIILSSGVYALAAPVWMGPPATLYRSLAPATLPTNFA